MARSGGICGTSNTYCVPAGSGFNGYSSWSFFFHAPKLASGGKTGSAYSHRRGCCTGE